MAFLLYPKDVSTEAIARWVYKNSVCLDTGGNNVGKSHMLRWSIAFHLFFIPEYCIRQCEVTFWFVRIDFCPWLGQIFVKLFKLFWSNFI